jgi:Collagen triple helix repeat (20 copies)
VLAEDTAMEELFSPDELKDFIETVVVVGEDGQPGTPGADGTDGVDGRDGADGADGVDGRPGDEAVITDGIEAAEFLDLLRDAGFEAVLAPYPNGPVAEVNLSDLYLL